MKSSRSIRVGTLIGKRRQMVDSRSETGVSEDYEYLICFVKQPEKRIRGQETDMSKYSNPDHDPGGDYGCPFFLPPPMTVTAVLMVRPVDGNCR